MAPGVRVGVGWNKNSCGECSNCKKGYENLCKMCVKALIVGVGPFSSKNPCGGFARSIRVPEKFAFPIPDGLSSEKAAPLLCAGATVYTPLKRYITEPGMEVGIAGIGGLGHLAIKAAVAMGANVTAMSSSDKKKGDRKELCCKRIFRHE